VRGDLGVYGWMVLYGVGCVKLGMDCRHFKASCSIVIGR
jgi:hypothetical protein